MFDSETNDTKVSHTITKNDLIEKYDIKDYTQPDFNVPDLSKMKGITLVVGSSGSGKSTILKENGYMDLEDYDPSSSVIDLFSSVEMAEYLLLASGFRSIPAWFRTPNEISNGEKARLEIALMLDNNRFVIDEFTSVIDRPTAKSLSQSLMKYVRKNNLDIIIASPHRDIIEWLLPDNVYDTDKQEFIKDLPRKIPNTDVTIKPTTKSDWIYFRKHHYLNTNLKGGMHCYIAEVCDVKIGFVSVMHMTGRDIKSFWRESRLVIIPEWQGLGIGKMLSDYVANLYLKSGHRYFSKTAHPALGEYRESSNLWEPTTTNKKKRKSYLKKDKTPRVSDGFGKTVESIIRDANRVTYSHEYVGDDMNHYFTILKSQCNNLVDNKCVHKKNKYDECIFSLCPFTKKISTRG